MTPFANRHMLIYLKTNIKVGKNSETQKVEHLMGRKSARKAISSEERRGKKFGWWYEILEIMKRDRYQRLTLNIGC